ncbi:MAG: DnaJ C-terminal domain-containing protein [Aliidongia sp.]
MNGDVLVEITVEPHPVLTRHDIDIHMVLPVTIQEAVLGGMATVPTIHGPVQLRIQRARIPIPGCGSKARHLRP